MKKLRGILVETFMWGYRAAEKNYRSESLFNTFLVFGFIFLSIFGIIWAVFGDIIPTYFGVNIYNFYAVATVTIVVAVAWTFWALWDMVRTGLYKRLLRLPRYEWKKIRIRASIFAFGPFILVTLLMAFCVRSH